MNVYMNDVALVTFSSFDSGRHPSGKTQPERFYHGFVLGLLAELRDRYVLKSNRESGLRMSALRKNSIEMALDSCPTVLRHCAPEVISLQAAGTALCRAAKH